MDSWGGFCVKLDISWQGKSHNWRQLCIFQSTAVLCSTSSIAIACLAKRLDPLCKGSYGDLSDSFFFIWHLPSFSSLECMSSCPLYSVNSEKTCRLVGLLQLSLSFQCKWLIQAALQGSQREWWSQRVGDIRHIQSLLPHIKLWHKYLSVGIQPGEVTFGQDDLEQEESPGQAKRNNTVWDSGRAASSRAGGKAPVWTWKQTNSLPSSTTPAPRRITYCSLNY